MKKSLGTLIADRRKEKGLTQAQLAQQMNVTDKAVSKWERDLSCPDINSLSRLAEILEVPVDQLLQGERADNGAEKKENILELILKAVPLAMGTAVVVLSFLGKLETDSGMTLLGIGLVSLSLYLMKNQK